jgi:hypothetical protein
VGKKQFFKVSVETDKMKTRFRLISLWLALSVAGGLTLGACAQTRGYQPLANPQADPRAASYNQDLEYCKGQASQTAQTGTQAAQGALAGGAVGAAGGAITGSLSKNVPMGKGAALGGALGALAGGAYGAYQGDQQYQTALWGCMHQLGHPVGY